MTLNISVTQHSSARSDPRHPNALDVQRDLLRRGYSLAPFGADGDFGRITDQAVRRFQTHVGIGVDGVVGPITWGRLNASFPSPTPSTTADRFYDKVAARCTGSDGHARLRYDYGYEISPLSQPFPSYADCSEIVQWGVYQETHDSWIDGSANQFAGCHHVSVSTALHTKGALVFLGGSPRGIYHVGVCKGDGKTVAQARSAHLSPSCGTWDDMRWDYAGLVPVLHY